MAPFNGAVTTPIATDIINSRSGVNDFGTNPALAILDRMKNSVRFSFMALLFGVPLYLVTVAEPTDRNLHLALAGLAVLPYFMVAYYRHSFQGWRSVMPQLERLSAGDLGKTGATGATRAGYILRHARADCRRSEKNYPRYSICHTNGMDRAS